MLILGLKGLNQLCFFSVTIGDDRHSLTINDTSVAWTALRESANRERRASMELERRGSVQGWFKMLADAVRFIRRTNTVDAPMKTRDEVLSYEEEFIVSINKQTDQLAIESWP